MIVCGVGTLPHRQMIITCFEIFLFSKRRCASYGSAPYLLVRAGSGRFSHLFLFLLYLLSSGFCVLFAFLLCGPLLVGGIHIRAAKWHFRYEKILHRERRKCGELHIKTANQHFWHVKSCTWEGRNAGNYI